MGRKFYCFCRSSVFSTTDSHTYKYSKEMYLKTIKDYEEVSHLPVIAVIPMPGYSKGLFMRDQFLRIRNLVRLMNHTDKCFLITSLHPGDGATTICYNLAKMFAAIGSEVIVLDLNLRRPRLHLHFGVPNTLGIINYLSGQFSLSHIIQTDDYMPNLKFVPSGSLADDSSEDEEDKGPSDNPILNTFAAHLAYEKMDLGFDPSKLLGSDDMRKLLYVLVENFDLVLIDSPPILDFPDAEVISSMVDAEIFVTSHNPKSVGSL